MWPDNQVTTDSAHLSDEQIRQMVRDPKNGGESPGEERQAASRHVASCDICQLRLEVLLNGGWSSGGPASGECPPHTVWNGIAAGITPPEEAQRSLAHAGLCATCARALRQASEDMRSELLPEEEVTIQGLATSRPEWPREFTRRLALEQSKPVRAGGWLRWQWVLGASLAAAAACILVFALFWQKGDQESVQALLASDYRSNRVIEFRLPGTEPGPMGTLRGKDREPSHELDKARATIDDQLNHQPSSPTWLDLKGRSQLLGGYYDSAIDTLVKAKGLPGAGLEVWNDLVVAYGKRSETQEDEAQRVSDLRAAYTVNADALARNPNDPVALFNKALLEERMGEIHNAVESLRHFIQLNPRSPWAAEAQQRLNRLEPLDRQHSKNTGTSPDDYLRSSLDPEAFIEEAVRTWLPNSSQENVRISLNKLANDMVSLHSDYWLREVLDQHGNEVAFQSLGAAAQENLHGDYHRALQDAMDAQEQFERDGAKAAAARARFERVYAEQRLLNGNQCSPDAQKLLQAVLDGRLTYLQVQAYLEMAVCHDFLGDFGRANVNADKAIALAQHAKLRFLGLRALGFRASLETTEGNPARAWKLCLDGLREYWSFWAPPMRAYHFLTEMEFTAEDDRSWEVAKSLQAEALHAIEQDEDLDLRAIAHFRLARLAVATDDTATAAHEFQRAAELFRLAPDQKTARLHELESRVGLAALQLKRGAPKEAEQDLDGVQTVLREADPYYLLVQYYATRGDLAWQEQQWDEAEAEYGKGVQIAEDALPRLSDGEARLRWSTETDHSYRALAAILIRRGETDAAWRLWQTHCSAALDPARVAVSTRQPAQKGLRVTYLQLDKGLAIWSSSGSERRFHYEPLNVEELQRNSERFLLLCSKPDMDSDDLNALARKLFRVLFGPVSHDLAGVTAVLIQPDVSLPDLPFEALEDDNGHFAGETHQILYSPGVGYDRETRLFAISSGPAIALIGDTNGSSGTLPGGDYEIQQFHQAFPQFLRLEGRSVTPDLLKQSLPSAGVLEFIGHGRESFTGTGLLVRHGNAEQADLVLDSALLNSLRLSHMQLAVLSACSTARGQRGLLDPQSLVQSFLRAGTRVVIASRWDVDSAATSVLLASFYQNLARSRDVSEALTLASSTVRTQRSAQPFYWAAFSVYE